MDNEPEPQNFRTIVKCPHGKTFWIPLAILKDPTVTAFGCGCPEGYKHKTPETPAAKKNRLRRDKKTLRKFKRQLKRL